MTGAVVVPVSRDVVVVAAMANVATWVIVVMTGVMPVVMTSVAAIMMTTVKSGMANATNVNMDATTAEVEANCFSLGRTQTGKTKTDDDCESDCDFLHNCVSLD